MDRLISKEEFSKVFDKCVNQVSDQIYDELIAMFSVNSSENSQNNNPQKSKINRVKRTQKQPKNTNLLEYNSDSDSNSDSEQTFKKKLTKKPSKRSEKQNKTNNDSDNSKNGNNSRINRHGKVLKPERSEQRSERSKKPNKIDKQPKKQLKRSSKKQSLQPLQSDKTSLIVSNDDITQKSSYDKFIIAFSTDNNIGSKNFDKWYQTVFKHKKQKSGIYNVATSKYNSNKYCIDNGLTVCKICIDGMENNFINNEKDIELEDTRFKTILKYIERKYVNPAISFVSYKKRLELAKTKNRSTLPEKPYNEWLSNIFKNEGDNETYYYNLLSGRLVLSPTKLQTIKTIIYNNNKYLFVYNKNSKVLESNNWRQFEYWCNNVNRDDIDNDSSNLDTEESENEDVENEDGENEDGENEDVENEDVEVESEAESENAESEVNDDDEEIEVIRHDDNETERTSINLIDIDTDVY